MSDQLDEGWDAVKTEPTAQPPFMVGSPMEYDNSTGGPGPVKFELVQVPRATKLTCHDCKAHIEITASAERVPKYCPFCGKFAAAGWEHASEG